MTCRICLEEEGDMIQPCNCRGSLANVHPDCLVRWLNISHKTECEICNFKYAYEERQEIPQRVYCPSYTLAEELNTSRIIVFFGITLCIITQMDGIAFSGMLNAVFICINAVVVVFAVFSICICEDIHVLETVTFWKLCTLLGFICLASFLGDWTYAIYDSIIFGSMALLTYLYLLHKEIPHTETQIQIII